MKYYETKIRVRFNEVGQWGHYITYFEAEMIYRRRGSSEF